MKHQKISVTVQPGCISCGTCQVVCPEVFEVKGISRVKQGVDAEKYCQQIEEAASMCPVGVILITKINEKL